MREIMVLACLGLLAMTISAQQRPADAPSALHPGGAVIVISSPAWVPHSLEALTDKADLIVDGIVAEVLPSRLWNPEDSISHCTDSVITVKRVLKGSITRKLLVYQRGGKVNGIEVVTHHDKMMEQGKRYILFLTKDTAAVKPENEDKEYFALTGLWNGKFSVEDGKVVPGSEATPELKTLDGQSVDTFLERVAQKIRLSR